MSTHSSHNRHNHIQTSHRCCRLNHFTALSHCCDKDGDQTDPGCGGDRTHTQHFTGSDLRWQRCQPFQRFICHSSEWRKPSINQKLRWAKAELNLGQSAYQPSTLPLGQASSSWIAECITHILMPQHPQGPSLFKQTHNFTCQFTLIQQYWAM